MRKLLLATAAAFAGAMAGAAQGRIDLDESGIRAESKAGVTAVAVAVSNTAGAAVSARLRLEWLNPENRALSAQERAVLIAPGESRLDMAAPLPSMTSNDQIYLRLRYTLSPSDPASRAFSTLTGIVALTSIASHSFVLHIARIDAAQPGTDYVVHAQAVHPATHKPVPGVMIEAALMVGESRIGPSNSHSDSTGSMAFTFPLPHHISERTEVNLRATARLGDFHQTTEGTLLISDRASARIETDKRLYQPGQTLHMRAIVLNAAGRAAAQERVKVRLRSPNQSVIREADLTSSRYGVVHQDFELPPTAELGSYHITVEAAKGGVQLTSYFVTVSRYELPTFTVSAKPDRSFYLPGQDATIDVSTTYLFGKPVPGAKVRVVASQPNRLPAPDDVSEGTADSSVHFLAHISLDTEHADLQVKRWDRFHDVSFEAYCTDPQSGHTEQIRFDVRITREPIHVYVMYPHRRGGPLPVPVYISTWYADGAPAETETRVRLGAQTARVRTNSFGIGKVLLAPEGTEIDVEAVDTAGLRAHWQEDVGSWATPTLRVRPAKSIYNQGEAVVLTIEAPDADLDVAINAVSQDRTIEIRHARLQKGVARVEFPYRPEFQRLVMFAAYAGDEREGYAAVVFPDGATLQLAATPNRKEYRPGENATVSFAVTASAGQSPQSALGVAIVDQAVAERTRTDAQFGRRAWTGCAVCVSPQSGGLTLEALYELDLSQSIPDGLDLAAEALLANQDTQLDIKSSVGPDWQDTFQRTIDKQFAPFVDALDRDYADTLSYPRDEAGVDRVVAAARLPADELRDPWGTRYAEELVTYLSDDVLNFKSAGPDKKFGTNDDFVAHTIERSHFRPHRIAIEEALRRWGKCATNLAEIRQALAANGVSLDATKDPWGAPYKVRLVALGWNLERWLQFESAGPDHKFETSKDDNDDTVRGDLVMVPCPVVHQREIQEALDNAETFPASEEEFRSRLAAAGIDTMTLLDPWNNPFSILIDASDRMVDYEHPVRLYAGLDAGRANPLAQRQVTITLRSAGDPNWSGRRRPFNAASFEGLLDPVPPGAATGVGALCGVVRAVTGAVIPGVSLELRRENDSAAGPSYRAVSGADGGYCLRGVSPGHYTLLAERSGIEPFELTKLPVADHYTTVVNVFLWALGNRGGARAFSAAALHGVSGGISGGFAAAISTPRVREYFPETLLWAPEVETDAQGRASLDFKLADNITNWRLTATASTPDGRLAQGSADIRAFQPFFVDLNPPPVLTAGDRVDLPVPVRNYLDQPQAVTVELQNNQWSELEGASRRQADAPANGSATVVFPLVAKSAIDAGHLRVVAQGAHGGDAIDKPVRVHPDGQETTQSAADLVSGRTALKMNIPAVAIAGATRGELRVYPSPLATLRDATKDVLSRPYGCAEQTTSAGQSNLVALRYARSVSFRNATFEKQAIRNLELTRDRLKTYVAPGGGVSYWGNGSADLAVTAYALRFLAEASEFIQIDPKLVQTSATWLMKQRGADGLWGAETEHSWSTTAVVIRGLASARRLPAPDLASVYQALSVQSGQPSPYVVAQFALAAIDLGDGAIAEKAIGSLKRSVNEDARGTYWQTASGTAFGGWGRPATLETTAAAVAALARWRDSHPTETSVDQLVRRAILYLLRNRDRYGVWYSTQATVAAMQAVAAASRILGGSDRTGGKVRIVVNGEALRDATVAPGEALRIDLSERLRAGGNQVELVPESGSGSMVAMVLATHWLPWAASSPRVSSDLRYKVAFDRAEAQPGENIECWVEASRSQGFGMLLAEVGLPPDVEVDRSSLEQALHATGAHLYRYDVLPDRVVLYLWPDQKGSSLRFSFHARFAMQAKSAPSLLYDYYNPDAMTEAAPVLFHVR
jgi:hypothetical protein